MEQLQLMTLRYVLGAMNMDGADYLLKFLLAFVVALSSMLVYKHLSSHGYFLAVRLILIEYHKIIQCTYVSTFLK